MRVAWRFGVPALHAHNNLQLRVATKELLSVPSTLHPQPKSSPIARGLSKSTEFSADDRNPPSVGARAQIPALTELRDASAMVDLSHARAWWLLNPWGLAQALSSLPSSNSSQNNG